jgi:glycosyltransferase involved in cell wall biosynthesis
MTMFDIGSLLRRTFGRRRSPDPDSAASWIARGDEARDHRDWEAASLAYREALGREPGLRHIWVQLGHAEKESGNFLASREAYVTAAGLPGNDGDPELHLGHLAKIMGNIAVARRCYADALRRAPENADAQEELRQLLFDPRTIGAHTRQAASHHRLAERERLEGIGGTVGAGTAIIFDVSDLVGYFRNARLPTGIQRVQIEVIAAALAGDVQTQVCCFSDDRGEWLRVPAKLFEEICAKAVSGGEMLAPEWTDLLALLVATLEDADPVAFAPGAFLVNLGTSWWLQNYFLHVREAKRRFGIHYVPFVHDFIPVMAPQHCVRELTQDFLSWTFGVFDHADFFLVNSQATRADLLKVAERLGYNVDVDAIAVIPLDADFRRPGRAELPARALSRWQLARRDYVLFVSTIESRKNHDLAFGAWLDLVAKHGEHRVPQLVCVGNRGWLNDRVYSMLVDHPVLSRKVTMLSRLGDEELALLYRECRFTVYPSSYEGWGLPVTESLCYGRIPLVTRSSSLPEAGGNFAVYVDLHDKNGLVSALDALMFDDPARIALERKIATDFVPRTWQAIAGQIDSELRRFMASGLKSKPVGAPMAEPGKFYGFFRNRAILLGEGGNSNDLFRCGTGWWQLEDWGCWTGAAGASLGFAVAEGIDRVACAVKLRGLADRPVTVELLAGDVTRTVHLGPEQWRWSVVEVPVLRGKVTLALCGSHSVDLSERSDYRDRRRISVGVAGFKFFDATYTDAPQFCARIERSLNDE